MCEIVKDKEDVEEKSLDMLRLRPDYWKETRVSEFALSLIENGYVPHLIENPPKYEEPKYEEPTTTAYSEPKKSWE